MRNESYNKYLSCLLLLVVTVCLLCAGCSNKAAQNQGGAYEVTDDQGTVVKFKEKPQRIMTVTLSTDNILLGLVKPEKVVAVNTLLDDPVSSNVVELAKQVPNKIRHPKVEEILAMNPDLVIAADWGNIEYVDALRNMGVNVVVVKGAKNLQDIKDNIHLMAQAVGEPEKGDKLIEIMDQKLAEIKVKVDKIPESERKTTVLVSLMNNYGGTGCIYDEACKLAGVRNGLAEAGLHRGDKLTKEMIVKIDPDILFMPSYNAHNTYDIDKFRNGYLKDPSLQQMKAIKTGNVKNPRDSYIYTASQDFCYAVQELAYVVYGDEFKLEDQQHISVAE